MNLNSNASQNRSNFRIFKQKSSPASVPLLRLLWIVIVASQSSYQHHHHHHLSGFNCAPFHSFVSLHTQLFHFYSLNEMNSYEFICNNKFLYVLHILYDKSIATQEIVFNCRKNRLAYSGLTIWFIRMMQMKSNRWNSTLLRLVLEVFPANCKRCIGTAIITTTTTRNA